MLGMSTLLLNTKDCRRAKETTPRYSAACLPERRVLRKCDVAGSWLWRCYNGLWYLCDWDPQEPAAWRAGDSFVNSRKSWSSNLTNFARKVNSFELCSDHARITFLTCLSDNLHILYDSSLNTVQDAACKLLMEAGTQSLIANLGEGLRGDEDPELVAGLVDFLHSQSEIMISSGR